MIYGVYKKDDATNEKEDLKVYSTNEDTVRMIASALNEAKHTDAESYHPFKLQVNGKDVSTLHMIV